MRNVDWAGKLMIIAAILGAITALFFFMTAQYTYDGGITDITLEGEVLDETGSPIEGATIKWVDENITRTTDAQGKYSFENMDSGTYDFKITAEGYRTLNYRLTLMPEGVTQQRIEQDFTLKPVNGSDNKSINKDESTEGDIYFFLAFMVVCSTIAFIGGYAILKRKMYYFCVASTVAAFFSLGLIIVSPILSVIALVILFRSRGAFVKRLDPSIPMINEVEFNKKE